MKIDINEYVASLPQEGIVGKNILTGFDKSGSRTYLVKNSSASTRIKAFGNDYFTLKNNVVLYAGDKEVGNFHVLICNKQDDGSILHFDRVCDYLFAKNNLPLSADEMLGLFNSLQTIFSTKGSIDSAAEIGFYGELATILFLYKNKIGNLYKNWHSELFSNHDMEINNRVKLDIKSTVKEKREHRIQHNQIYRKNLEVYIISCLLTSCEKGISLYQLCLEVQKILNNSDQIIAIETMMKKLNLSESYQGLNCVLEDVFESIRLYPAKDVPHLKCGDIPGVTKISYDSDLSQAPNMEFNNLLKHI